MAHLKQGSLVRASAYSGSSLSASGRMSCPGFAAAAQCRRYEYSVSATALCT